MMLFCRSKVLGALALSLAGCMGAIGNSDPGRPEVPNGDELAPVRGGVSPKGNPSASACSGTPTVEESFARELSGDEYGRIVFGLLGTAAQAASGFLPVPISGVTAAHVEQFLSTAEQVASALAVQSLSAPGCDSAVLGADTCALRALDSFAARAMRHPLSDSDHTRLEKLFRAELAARGQESAVRLAIEWVLMHPRFLYRIELGTPLPDYPQIAHLDPWESAARLSFLLLDDLPDDTLLARSTSGELFTPAELAEQSSRLAHDPRARAQVARFHSGWLSLDSLDAISKDPVAYPSFTPSLRQGLRQETELFLDDLFWGEKRTRDLFTSTSSFVNREVGAFYGLATLPPGEGFQRAPLDPAQRRGLLTQASILSIQAKPNQTSPVKRGHFVRSRILCGEPPPPPANVNTTVSDPDPHLTTRQRSAEHSANPSCAACHRLMDPIGLGLENYDGIGAFRTVESSQRIDSSGEIVESDVAGTFRGPMELSDRLAESEDVKACLAQQWFAFAFGRRPGVSDACSLQQVISALQGGSMRSILPSIVTTDAFVFRKVIGEENSP